MTSSSGHAALSLSWKLFDVLQNGDIYQVRNVLNQGANPNLLLPAEAVTPFHIACGLHGSEGIGMTMLLLQYRADPNVRSEDGTTPLHVAAIWGNVECLKLLLQNGADPSTLDMEEKSARDMAVEYGHTECVELLDEFSDSEISNTSNADSLYVCTNGCDSEGWSPNSSDLSGGSKSQSWNSDSPSSSVPECDMTSESRGISLSTLLKESLSLSKQHGPRSSLYMREVEQILEDMMSSGEQIYLDVTSPGHPVLDIKQTSHHSHVQCQNANCKKPQCKASLEKTLPYSSRKSHSYISPEDVKKASRHREITPEIGSNDDSFITCCSDPEPIFIDDTRDPYKPTSTIGNHDDTLSTERQTVSRIKDGLLTKTKSNSYLGNNILRDTEETKCKTSFLSSTYCRTCDEALSSSIEEESNHITVKTTYHSPIHMSHQQCKSSSPSLGSIASKTKCTENWTDEWPFYHADESRRFSGDHYCHGQFRDDDQNLGRNNVKLEKNMTLEAKHPSCSNHDSRISPRNTVTTSQGNPRKDEQPSNSQIPFRYYSNSPYHYTGHVTDIYENPCVKETNWIPGTPNQSTHSKDKQSKVIDSSAILYSATPSPYRYETPKSSKASIRAQKVKQTSNTEQTVASCKHPTIATPNVSVKPSIRKSVVQMCKETAYSQDKLPESSHYSKQLPSTESSTKAAVECLDDSIFSHISTDVSMRAINGSVSKSPLSSTRCNTPVLNTTFTVSNKQKPPTNDIRRYFKTIPEEVMSSPREEDDVCKHSCNDKYGNICRYLASKNNPQLCKNKINIMPQLLANQNRRLSTKHVETLGQLHPHTDSPVSSSHHGKCVCNLCMNKHNTNKSGLTEYFTASSHGSDTAEMLSIPDSTAISRPADLLRQSSQPGRHSGDSVYSTIDVVDQLYKDPDTGVTLIERYCPSQLSESRLSGGGRLSLESISSYKSSDSDSTVIYDWKSFTVSHSSNSGTTGSHDSGCGQSGSDKSPPSDKDQAELKIPVHLQRLDNNELKQKLFSLGDDPGPVTEYTRKAYLQRLVRLQDDPDLIKTINSNHQTPSYPPELCSVLAGNQNDMGLDDMVQEMVNSFSNPLRTWREGTLKSSFNYLLLDPRVTKNLPARAAALGDLETFRAFIGAIFYIGKGKRSRPYCHLYDAISHCNCPRRKASSKVSQILDIWKEGVGVVSLHFFQSVIPVEAYTREACMVDAIGLNRITNVKRGDYYGLASTWTAKQKRQVGVYLLRKALQIFLAEGERQICIPDIKVGQ